MSFAHPEVLAAIQPPYPIRTARLRLRPVTHGDVAAINAYRSLPGVARYLPHPPQSVQDTELTVKSMAAQSELTRPGQWLDLAVEHADSGELVGEVLLKWDAANPQCGEIGFVFSPTVQGQGVAYEACTAALDVAFREFGWHRVEGICDARNDKSAALMSRLGMRAEARFLESDWSKGEWVTLLHYGILRREWLARA
ncbi:GNAT family N-acetyltransferase [Arthrobacter sp. GMC3]|uniref:GNAT family N-acetyltransferase n=1 Tax=Arthrobacter sp. GMC3 TaxID=2058894 RepID=UPI000CE55103|nr:GNAT family protein [Arthrobacter sp. GMC3]